MSGTIPQNALVVVADGGKAILFRVSGSADKPTLAEERRMTPSNLADEGPSGSRPEDQTPKQTDEATFAKQLGHVLYDLKQKGTFDNLVLCADPQTLGQIRSVLHKTVEASLVRSLNKDLTNHSPGEIASALFN